VGQSTLGILARFDTLYLKVPCSGSHRMVVHLAREGIPISLIKLRNFMRRMGLRAIFQMPHTSVQGDPSVRFPCLFNLMAITAVDQAWVTDITYIPLQKAFLYLVAMMDLFIRNVYPFVEAFGYSSKLSNSLDAEF
jgi:putative transposase